MASTNHAKHGRPELVLIVPLTLLLLSTASGLSADRQTQAAAIRTRLIEKIMPYWHDTAIDRSNGGFILADDGTGKPAAASEKQLVSQARMIWGFSHAHLKGLGHTGYDYLAAAKQGREFLSRHFLDSQHGGYFWTTDISGKPLNRNKIVYGQSFVIYGLVEYHRASRDKTALDQAVQLYHLLQKHSRDPVHGGWVEHFRADWTPIMTPTRDAIVEVAGYKSANTHLHLMEAFTELYEATEDPTVAASLREALNINMKYFYPRNPGRSCFHRKQDWSQVTDPASGGLSYGHNVEFAWLMVRAQQVLKRNPAWAHFNAHIDHALKYGYDHALGGLYNRGVENQPANNRDKIWWVQSEMLAALTESLAHQENSAHASALDSLLSFIDRYQADPKDGIWFDTVNAQGEPKARAKAHNWKANYHDIRALVKFVETFSATR